MSPVPPHMIMDISGPHMRGVPVLGSGSGDALDNMPPMIGAGAVLVDEAVDVIGVQINIPGEGVYGAFLDLDQSASLRRALQLAEMAVAAKQGKRT